jgi:hypothetical protein
MSASHKSPPLSNTLRFLDGMKERRGREKVHVNRNIKIRVKKGFCCLNLGRALTNPKMERK